MERETSLFSAPSGGWLEKERGFFEPVTRVASQCAAERGNPG